MINIKIETNSILFSNAIKQDVPDGVSVNVLPYRENRQLGTETVIAIAIGVAQTAVAFLIPWLTSKKLTKHATKITIDEKEIALEYVEIKRIIHKQITIEK